MNKYKRALIALANVVFELVEGESVFVPLSRAPQGWGYVEGRDD